MPDGSAQSSTPHAPFPGLESPPLVLATLVAVDEQGLSLSYPGAPTEPQPVLATIPLAENDVGCVLALAFIDGARERPIVIGRVRDPFEDPDAPLVVADGERVRVEARQELVLCCGKASITLRANGRVVVRGTYVESRAQGVNRIRGGTVAIN